MTFLSKYLSPFFPLVLLSSFILLLKHSACLGHPSPANRCSTYNAFTFVSALGSFIFDQSFLKIGS